MSTLTKYLLLQVPGWVLAAVIVTGLRYWMGIPRWAAWGLFSLWVIKDLVMYPLLRTAYESGVKTGVEQLIGARGVAQEDLAPAGYVRVRGELWRAETKSSQKHIPSGTPIRIVGAERMTLIVETDRKSRREPTHR
jgi:membrane protein implicated in regulation of membrane protease activity